MTELEIQTLSERREGLLMEVGRSVTAVGFTLQRQRMTQDVNGVLMSMVVRGPGRKQRALETALESLERLISFEVSTVAAGASKPHFAASRTFARPSVAPAPAAPETPASTVTASPEHPPVTDMPPQPTPVEQSALVKTEAAAANTVAMPDITNSLASVPQVELAPAAEPAPPEPDFEFILPTPRASAKKSAEQAPEPIIDIPALEADVEAVEKLLGWLETDYPQIVDRLHTLEQSVAAGARESSLELAGQRTGAWLAERDGLGATGLNLHEALETIGVPALKVLIDVAQDGGQLHIRNSPLCNEPGHSGCIFFSGLLQGLLAPVVSSDQIFVFAMCCRSCGADECVLAISD